MKVCIGIATKNRAEIIPQAIDSALSQSYADVEVVVFDDASTDGMIDLPRRYPQVRWIRVEESIGYMAARNQLMRETDADFFCSLDDDSWFLGTDEIATAMTFLENRPGVGAIAFDIIDPSYPEHQGRGAPQQAHTFIGCGHLLRLTAVREAGYYTSFPGAYGGEEKDLSVQLLDLGYEILRLPGVHVWHDKTMTARDLRQQHASGVCNDLAFAYLRCPMWDLAWTLPGKLLSNIAFAVRFAFTRDRDRDKFDREVVTQIGRWGFLSPSFRGIGAFFSGLDELQSSREPVDAIAWRSYTARARRLYGRVPLAPVSSIAISLTTRNRKDTLASTLQELRRLDPAPDEMIICADGCEDDTVEMLRRDWPEIRVIVNESWEGSIPSRHRMLLQAESDIVLSLDDDSYPIPDDFLFHVLQSFNSTPLAAVITFPQVTDEFPETLTQIRAQEGARSLVGSFTNSGAAIRREIYERLDGYAGFFQHAYEEPDYALQCYASGYEVLFEPSLTIRHLYSRESRNEQRTHRFHARNEIWSALLRCPLPFLPIVVIYRTGSQFAYAIKRGLHWVCKEPLWWREAIQGLGTCLKHRSALSLNAYLRWMLLIRKPAPLESAEEIGTESAKS